MCHGIYIWGIGRDNKHCSPGGHFMWTAGHARHNSLYVIHLDTPILLSHLLYVIVYLFYVFYSVDASTPRVPSLRVHDRESFPTEPKTRGIGDNKLLLPLLPLVIRCTRLTENPDKSYATLSVPRNLFGSTRYQAYEYGIYIQGAPHACRLSPAHMLREGVKGLWGREDGQEISSVLLVVVVGVRVKDNAKWWKC